MGNTAAEAGGKGKKRLVTTGPPIVTVVRRAKSFSDFYDTVREYSKIDKAEKNWYGQLDQDVLQQQIGITRKNGKKYPMKEVKTEIEFYDWYNELEDELIEASIEELA